MFLLSLFLQSVRGDSALAVGLIFLPMSLAAMAANLLGGRLTARLGSQLPMAGGQLIFALGLLGLLAAGPAAPDWAIWLNTARQVGGAAGVALFGALVAGHFIAGLRVSLAIASIALICSSAAAARWGRG